MLLIESITPKWQHLYESSLIQTATIKNHHLKHHVKSINWKTICMLIGTDSKQYPTFVIDSNHGIYAVKQTPQQIISELDHDNPLIGSGFLFQLTDFMKINKYRPISCGKLNFAPLKTTNGITSYIALHQIQDYHVGQHTSKTTVIFNNIETEVEIDVSEYFMHQRSEDFHRIRLAQEHLIDYINTLYDFDNFDGFNQHKYAKNSNKMLELIRFIKRKNAKIMFEYLDIDYTEEMLEEAANRLMQKK